MKILLPLLLLALVQDKEDARAEVSRAGQASLEKGSFTFRIVPSADLRDALPKDRVTVAGVPLAGERVADGLFHVHDGTREIYGSDANPLVRTQEGWRRALDVAKELAQKAKEEFGDDRHNSRNVTQGKAAMTELFALAHLVTRVSPADRLLAKLGEDLEQLKRTGSDSIDGRSCRVYEGTMEAGAARLFLQGPYEWLVKAGTLEISEASGRGKIWIDPDGLVRRTVFKAVGKYTTHEKRANIKKTNPVAIEVAVHFSRYGETTIKVPAEVEEKLSGEK